jgi:hypothetical protein
MVTFTLPAATPVTLEWIEEQEAFHKAKLDGLAKLKEAYLGVFAAASAVARPIPPASSWGTPVPAPVPSVGTKKATILRAIAGSPNGLVTQEIVSACINAGFSDTNQSNTSPQLSLYKSRGEIELEDGRWKITGKGRFYIELAFAAAQKN